LWFELRTQEIFFVRSYDVNYNTSYLRQSAGFLINEEELLSGTNPKKDNYWKYIPKSFRNASQGVFFDVVTTYNIFKLREACSNVIPNYAKVKVLEQFNNVLNFLLHKHLRFHSFYVILNARSLNIDVSKMTSEYPNMGELLKAIAFKITSIVDSW
jgi:hypothetical protein